MKFSPEFVLTTPTLHFVVPSANDALPLGCTSPPSRPSSLLGERARRGVSLSVTEHQDQRLGDAFINAANSTGHGTPQRRVAGLRPPRPLRNSYAYQASTSVVFTSQVTTHLHLAPAAHLHSQAQRQRART